MDSCNEPFLVLRSIYILRHRVRENHRQSLISVSGNGHFDRQNGLHTRSVCQKRSNVLLKNSHADGTCTRSPRL